MVTESHMCSIITRWRKFALIFSAFLYSCDTFLDFNASFFMCKEGETIWGILVLAISLSSFVVTNNMSRSRRFDRRNHFIPTADGDFKFNPPGRVRKYSLRGYFCPWDWNTKHNFLLNCFAILQLNPVIDALELIFHEKQSFRSITLKYAHYKANKKFDKMFGNSFLVTIQTISLVELLDRNEIGSLYFGMMLQIGLRFLSVISSCISLAYIVSTEEKARRFAEVNEYDMKMSWSVQIIPLFIGYLLLYISRVSILALNYHCFIKENSKIGFYTLISVEAHHLLIFSIYILFSYSKMFDHATVEKRRSAWVLLPTLYILSFTEVFVVNLRFPVRSIGLIMNSTPGKPLGHRSRKVFSCLYLLFCVEMVCIIIFHHSGPDSATEDILSTMSYLSLVLFIMSTALFSFYFHSCINPDARKERFGHKFYTESLITITCDVISRNLPSIGQGNQVRLSHRDTDSSLPGLFTDFILADSNIIMDRDAMDRHEMDIHAMDRYEMDSHAMDRYKVDMDEIDRDKMDRVSDKKDGDEEVISLSSIMFN